MNKVEKKEVGRTEWKIAALAWGNVKNAGQHTLERGWEQGKTKSRMVKSRQSSAET